MIFTTQTNSDSFFHPFFKLCNISCFLLHFHYFYYEIHILIICDRIFIKPCENFQKRPLLWALRRDCVSSIKNGNHFPSTLYFNLEVISIWEIRLQLHKFPRCCLIKMRATLTSNNSTAKKDQSFKRENPLPTKLMRWYLSSCGASFVLRHGSVNSRQLTAKDF